MSHKSKRASRAAGSIFQFFAGAAESFRRAQEAQEIMNRPDSFFESRRTTRERSIRRVFEV